MFLKSFYILSGSVLVRRVYTEKEKLKDFAKYY